MCYVCINQYACMAIRVEQLADIYLIHFNMLVSSLGKRAGYTGMF